MAEPLSSYQYISLFGTPQDRTNSLIYDPRHQKTCFLHMQNQGLRSAVL